MSSVSLARGDLSVARYRRDRLGLGESDPNPICTVFMAVVILRPRPAHAGWQNGRTIEAPAFRAGTLAALDLRETWTFDLSDPFDSFNAFIPQTAFDDVTSELRQPKIERLNCSITAAQYDETMLGLAQALNPLLARPHEAPTLFTDHVFFAMVTHLAATYGGLNRSDIQGRGLRRRGMLTPLRERRVTSRLLDDLSGDPGLSELALLCGLSRGHFIRAFKQTTGLPPHRWLSMQRVERAKGLLQNTKMSIVEIALQCGFADQSHFTRVFSKALGISPGTWRRLRED